MPIPQENWQAAERLFSKQKNDARVNLSNVPRESVDQSSNASSLTRHLLQHSDSGKQNNIFAS